MGEKGGGETKGDKRDTLLKGRPLTTRALHILHHKTERTKGHGFSRCLSFSSSHFFFFCPTGTNKKSEQAAIGMPSFPLLLSIHITNAGSRTVATY